jgi:hypothetical protein
MSSVTVRRVDVSTVHPVDELGDGGQGLVRLVRVDGEPDPLAYKEYRSTVGSEVNWVALEALVTLRADAEPEVRDWLDAHAAWPRAIVADGGSPRGFLMPVAPPPFTISLRTSDAYRPQLFAFELLLNPPEYLRRIDLRVSQVDGLLLLVELAVLLGRLHELGIVVGDLSPRNVAVSLDPVPRCFLLDCDAVRYGSVSALPQVETPEWRVPVGEQLGTPASDVFKLGLLTIRLLAGDQAVHESGVLRPDFDELADLVASSTALDADRRPGVDAWPDALRRAVPLASSVVPDTAPLTPHWTKPETGAAPTGGRAIGSKSPARPWLWVGIAIVILVCLGLIAECSTRSSPGTSSGAGSSANGYGGGSSNGSGSGSTADDGSGTNGGAVVGSAPTTAATPTVTGIVSYPDLVDDARAPAVAAMFDTYFEAINNSDIDTALSVFDPAGAIDTSDPRQRNAFGAGVQTSRDTDVVIESLAPGADGVAVVATVTFTSHQDQGYGPKRNPNETCSHWAIAYSLSEPQPGQYRLLKSSGSSTPC